MFPLGEAYRARVHSTVGDPRRKIDDVKSILGVRGGQIKRLVTTPDGDDVAQTTVHLVRVSRRDIRNGVARMKEEPGVHAVEIKTSKARREPS
jgi:putative Mg2+ transporter-C (MgtC) family protein